MTVSGQPPPLPRRPASGPPGGAGPAAPHLVRELSGQSHNAAAALVSGAHPYRSLLEALGVAVYTTDAAGRITFFNDAAAALWGRRPALGEEWCGSWRLYWPGGARMAHAECPLAVALRDGVETHGQEAVAERPDGTRVSFVTYPTPLRDESGGLVGAVNVLVDVTERRRAEEQLRATADALRLSNAVKDEFLGLVSHELRTPLTTIFGNARLLRDRSGRLSELDRESMIADVADESERLLAIVENLLLLTRLGSGTPPELELQILSHIVARETESFRRRRGGAVALDMDGAEHLIVEADRTHLELLLENLLENADKFSPPGGAIDIAIRAADGEVEVHVLDRGIGLSEAEAENVFTAFYRTEAAKRRTHGAGIGLAVCKRIVDASRGRVWARPREGGGADIGFALPLTTEPAVLAD